MNPFEFVLAIIIVTGVFQILRHRMGVPNPWPRGQRRQGMIQEQSGDPMEAERLRNEVRQLKERVQVLERIATDKEDTLSRQIESLRDR